MKKKLLAIGILLLLFLVVSIYEYINKDKLNQWFSGSSIDEEEQVEEVFEEVLSYQQPAEEKLEKKCSTARAGTINRFNGSKCEG